MYLHLSVSQSSSLLPFALFEWFPTILREPFERLRYPFGGDRPSQTPHLTLSPTGSWLLVRKPNTARVVSQQRLRDNWRYHFPSLPPILYMQYRVPVPNWSKAPWGLSVLAQVTSIFTGISISPGALLRQCPNHYAFRAGRNLPDKEFRYLRTVIVTAAVYWGLNSKLRVTANLSS